MSRNEEQEFKSLLQTLNLDKVQETSWDPNITRKRAHELIDLVFIKSINSRLTHEGAHHDFLSKLGTFLSSVFDDAQPKVRKMNLSPEEREARRLRMQEVAARYWASPAGRARKARVNAKSPTGEIARPAPRVSKTKKKRSR